MQLAAKHAQQLQYFHVGPAVMLQVVVPLLTLLLLWHGVLLLQLADDFAELCRPGAFVAPDGDELNLVYVAITRAMLGLVCNRDVALLLTEKATKRLQVEVSDSARFLYDACVRRRLQC